MNKQQLAAKIWESANEMRSKIEANEYKDYILGFMFYKFLSDKEEQFLSQEGYGDDLSDLSESDEETVKYIQEKIGYFISYDNLFSTWIKKGVDFDVSNVRDALSAFNRLIGKGHKHVFDGVFDTLQTGLSKLGESSASQTKAISRLLTLIKSIPMEGRRDYDVLGFIYEYLISMFAANAGKKAGEFYTPHEVSVLISEIVAHHLHDKDEIKIYDPTSGSGSLLINIGQSASKFIQGENKIQYYAQELKSNTYNLTRMNLIMRGILPSNIITRNGDTLEDDWPYFNENDPVNTYNPLYVDAVVSNPPYSQKWDSEHKEDDPRYFGFGLAPRTKADYAFLLHDLYHLKPDGIMAIVLPHGVLFRGGEERKIRMNLIEKNKIDAIIGLPSNIFFGTGIPTIIMVLKQHRDRDDILIVDASKGFVKVGKNNQLRASDIKKIVDIVNNRETIEGYSRLVSKEELRQQDYNLNIPRYVDSSEPQESWDIYASMYGGIPKSELTKLDPFWCAFPGLFSDLFEDDGSPYVELKSPDLKQVILNNEDIKKFLFDYHQSFESFSAYLYDYLVVQALSISLPQAESVISQQLFKNLYDYPIVDPYTAYQLLDDGWQEISQDLEMIQTEGFQTVKRVDPNIVIKKKKGKEPEEQQEGWIGRILPFELVQEVHLTEELDQIKAQKARLQDIKDTYVQLIDNLSEEEKELQILNDEQDGFITKEVNLLLEDIYTEVDSLEISTLRTYLDLLDRKAQKAEKMDFIAAHPEVSWSSMEALKDKTYGAVKVKGYIRLLQSQIVFEEGSFEATLQNVIELQDEEKQLAAIVKKAEKELHLKTKQVIENLSDEEANELLEKKWIVPVVDQLNRLPDVLFTQLIKHVTGVADKYSETFEDVSKELAAVEQSLSDMIDQLDGPEFDMKGLREFQNLLNRK
ncbi:type I restriction-modification system subunit M [Streptococcus oralis]|uniref:site-specific DNA-methyltransferase (adenine-specific) n=1 Tax=Streptococcus oralis TaxID=1303 RepID=A0A139R210_STROR|nr:type I restriction-modification system subunit M [Streptococcus oralis]KXU08798.1 Type I restriction-modification system, DNA-methyltransferase subunit M [Streptococcus oralis]